MSGATWGDCKKLHITNDKGKPDVIQCDNAEVFKLNYTLSLLHEFFTDFLTIKMNADLQKINSTLSHSKVGSKFSDAEVILMQRRTKIMIIFTVI